MLTNSGKGAKLKENTRPAMAYHADTSEQEPLSPTLKRKKTEVPALRLSSFERKQILTKAL